MHPKTPPDATAEPQIVHDTRRFHDESSRFVMCHSLICFVVRLIVSWWYLAFLSPHRGHGSTYICFCNVRVSNVSSNVSVPGKRVLGCGCLASHQSITPILTTHVSHTVDFDSSHLPSHSIWGDAHEIYHAHMVKLCSSDAFGEPLSLDNTAPRLRTATSTGILGLFSSHDNLLHEGKTKDWDWLPLRKFEPLFSGWRNMKIPWQDEDPTSQLHFRPGTLSIARTVRRAHLERIRMDIDETLWIEFLNFARNLMLKTYWLSHCESETGNFLSRWTASKRSGSRILEHLQKKLATYHSLGFILDTKPISTVDFQGRFYHSPPPFVSQFKSTEHGLILTKSLWSKMYESQRSKITPKADSKKRWFCAAILNIERLSLSHAADMVNSEQPRKRIITETWFIIDLDYIELCQPKLKQKLVCVYS